MYLDWLVIYYCLGEPKIIGVVASRRLEAGEVIYIEDPAVACLTPEALASKNYCLNCTQELPENARGDADNMITSGLESDPAVFCSTSCMERAMPEFYMLLCAGNTQNPAAKDLFDYCLNERVTYPWMVARFIARMVWKQQVGGENAVTAQSVLDEWEHYGKMPMAPIDPTDETIIKESTLVRAALKFAVPGAEEFLSAERYASLKSSIMTNAYALNHYSDPNLHASTTEPHPRCSDKPFIGCGLYYLSAYLTAPVTGTEANAEVSFKATPTRRQKYRQDPLKSSLSPKLILKATKPIEEGELICVSYVPLQQAMEEAELDLVGQ